MEDEYGGIVEYIPNMENKTIVVPAKAGTHNPCDYESQSQWLWIPAGACHRAALCADPLAGMTGKKALCGTSPATTKMFSPSLVWTSTTRLRPPCTF